MSLKLLRKSLEEAPIVKKGTYYYVVHPLTDGVPDIKPDLLSEVTSELQRLIKECGDIDKIVTIEAMGIPLATILSSDMGIPFTVIRKKSYGLPDEVDVEQVTGYSKSKLYINGLAKGDRIVIVDDVVSTGGTLQAVLSVLRTMGVENKGVFIVINKGKSAEEISNEYDVPITSLVDIDIVKGEVVIL